MMGDRLVRKGRLFYDVCLEDRVPPDHLVRRLDAVLELSWLRGRARAVLQPHGLPVGGSRADDPDDAARLLLFDPLRPAAVAGSRHELRLPLVLRSGFGGPGSRPLDVFGQTPWPVPRQQVRLPRVSRESAMSSELTGAPGPT